MTVLADIDDLAPGLPFVATVGVFDGVHRGHAHVLDVLIEAASELGATPVALTFDPHPEAVVTGRPPLLLCSVEERVERLLAHGVAIVVVQRFDEAFRQQSAEAFLHRLRAGRHLRGLVMSPESAFGHDREGTIELVRRVAAEEGWRCVETPLVEVGGERVSSGRNRALVQAGRLDDAAAMLGRPYAIVGGIDGIGSEAGGLVVVPRGGSVLPPPGRYAVRVGQVGPERRRAVADGTWGEGELLGEPAGTGLVGPGDGSRLRLEAAVPSHLRPDRLAVEIRGLDHQTAAGRETGLDLGR